MEYHNKVTQKELEDASGGREEQTNEQLYLSQYKHQ